VDGADTYTCFELKNSNAVLDGLTITNGQGLATHSTLGGSGYAGGGAYLLNGTVRNCLLVNNRALTNIGYNGSTGGGGAYTRNADALISNCVFRGNQAVWGQVTFPYNAQGGGIYMDNGRVVDCQFYDNASTNGGGGGVYMVTGSIYNCYFYGNWCWGNGGGVYANAGMVADCQVVSNCSVSGSGGGVNGGGVYLGSASAFLRDSIVASNVSRYGAGVGMQNGATVSNCVIRGNHTSEQEGKGMGAALGKNAVLVNCLIVDNYGSAPNILQQGAGVWMNEVQSSTTRVVNCTIVSNAICGNTPAGKPGLSMRNDMTGFTSVFEVVDCIIYSNKTGTVFSGDWSASGTNVIMRFANNCATPTMNGLNGGGTGNITNDPKFVDAAGGNYRLLRRSPCVNTGTNQNWMNNTLDLDGHPRLDHANRLVDMGAYEYVFPGTLVMLR
jgi:hypothetical protein